MGRVEVGEDESGQPVGRFEVVVDAMPRLPRPMRPEPEVPTRARHLIGARIGPGSVPVGRRRPPAFVPHDVEAGEHDPEVVDRSHDRT